MSSHPYTRIVHEADDTPGAAAVRSRPASAVIPLDALVFALAGICTCLTLTDVLGLVLADVASMLGGVLTLAGLCIVSLGLGDERPLRRIRFAAPLLMSAAVAGVLQTTTLQLLGALQLGARTSVAVVTTPGIVGGALVGAAIVLLVRRRAEHPVLTSTLVGLAVIAVAAVVTNTVALSAGLSLMAIAPGLDLARTLVHASVLAAGAGQVLIAVGMWVVTRRRATGTRR